MNLHRILVYILISLPHFYYHCKYRGFEYREFNTSRVSRVKAVQSGCKARPWLRCLLSCRHLYTLTSYQEDQAACVITPNTAIYNSIGGLYRSDFLRVSSPLLRGYGHREFVGLIFEIVSLYILGLLQTPKSPALASHMLRLHSYASMYSSAQGFQMPKSGKETATTQKNMLKDNSACLKNST